MEIKWEKGKKDTPDGDEGLKHADRCTYSVVYVSKSQFWVPFGVCLFH